MKWKVLSNSDFTCLFIIKFFLEGEGNGGARGGGEEEDGEEGRKGGVDLIIKVASYIDKEEQIKGKGRQKKYTMSKNVPLKCVFLSY